MGLLDEVTAQAKRAITETGKAFEKGTAKAVELELEMRMDTAAKKLGYLVFDEHRGRSVDGKTREHLVNHLADLEGKMVKLRAKVAVWAGKAPPA